MANALNRSAPSASTSRPPGYRRYREITWRGVLRRNEEGDRLTPRSSMRRGALAGGISALAFTVLHDGLIVDIWDNVAAMVLAGILCGFCLSWSYANTRGTPSVAGWLAYNALHVALLLALGVASLILLEPTSSMAELVASTDPLGDLLPLALPLMAWSSVIGTGVVWAVFGERLRSLPSMFITHTLLVLFIGHNLAILGLVELANVLAALGSFFGVTLFLGASFAVAHVLLDLQLVARLIRGHRRVTTVMHRRSVLRRSANRGGDHTPGAVRR